MGDVDRRKHDVDVIERVLGGVRDNGNSTQLVNIEVPWVGGSMRSTVELTVGLPEESRDPHRDPDRDRRR